VAARPAPAVAAEDPPFDMEDAPAAASPIVKPASGNQKAEDILAMIRSRQK
jgi:hypothetical protein